MRSGPVLFATLLTGGCVPTLEPPGMADNPHGDFDDDGFTEDQGDCDDEDDSVAPGQDEVCDDGLDNDCNGDDIECRLAGRRTATEADAVLLGEAAGEQFGSAVAGVGDLDGDGRDDFAVGAYGYEGETGRAWIYSSRRLDGGQEGHRLLVEQGTDGAWTGCAVSGAGDLDGDGLDEALVGAPFSLDESERYYGQVAVVSDFDADEPSVTWVTSDPGFTGLGFAVSPLGDADGDGLADYIAGAPYTAVRDDALGAAFVVLGSADFRGDPSPETRRVRGVEEATLGAELVPSAGTSVAGAGDVDGDGLGDALLGSPFADSGARNAGLVWLFVSPIPEEAQVTDADAQLEGTGIADYAGLFLGGGSDLDDDGLPDLVVGSPGTGGYTGTAWFVAGTVRGSASLPDAAFGRLEGETSGTACGTSVATGGDVDGDGTADVLIGCPGEDAGGRNAGAAALLFAPVSGTRLLADAPFLLDGGTVDDAAGQSVAISRDLDDDGLADLLVGASKRDEAAADAGAVLFVLGDGI